MFVIRRKGIAFIIIVFTIMVFGGCAGTTKQLIRTGTGEKNAFINIIINDEKIKDVKCGSKLVGKIEEVFRKSFENVSVRTGYDNPESGELLVTPEEVDVEDEQHVVPLTGKATSWSTIMISYNSDCEHYCISGYGEYDPSATERLASFPLHLGTLSLSLYAHWALSKSIAKNRALESIAIDLHNKIISSPRFTAYTESTKMLKTSAASLTTEIQYSDKSCLLPNSTIDAAEQSTIIATITNNGKGTAFDVNAEIATKYKNIDFSKTIKVGDIQPGESQTITIPVKADLSLQSGTANFLIKVHEKRGYDARPVELQVAAQSLQGPKLAVVSCSRNDASGLAQGNGDNIPQNNETIELTPFIKNDGIGDALKVTVKLSSVTEGIEIVKRADDLSSIGKGTTGKATLAFRIPRTFNKPEIRYTVSAVDTRGMSTKKTYTIPFEPSAPRLYYTYQIVDRNNREISALENGESYSLRVTPKNIGNNVAEGVTLKVQPAASRVNLGNYNHVIGSLRADSIGSMVTVPLLLQRSFANPKLDITISMSQKFFDGISRKISLPVRAKRPELACQVTLLNGIADNAVSRNSRPRFRVSVSNAGNLDANNVSVRFKVASKKISFDKKDQIGTVKAGESQYRDFTFFIRGDTPTGDMPVTIDIKQDDFSGIDRTLAYRLKEQTALVQKVQSVKKGALPVSGSIYAGQPEVYVNTPNRNSKTYKESIDLHGNIITFGRGNGLSKLNIYLNGKSLSVIPTSGELRLDPDQITKRQVSNEKIVFDGAINLRHGENTIRIQCVDFNNQTSEQTIKVVRQAKLGNIYAVVIGVSEFWNKDYNLKYAESDAGKFYKFLKSEKGGTIPDSKVRFLSNSQAKRAQVISALTNLLGKTTKDDTVEIYIATHGLMDTRGNLYYLCHDTDIDNLRGTGLSDKEFTDILNENVKAGKVIIYLDVCHAGRSGLSRRYAKRGIEIHEVNERISNLASALSKSSNGVVTFSASSASGASLEDSKFGGGVFTHCLIKGLTGDANSSPNDE